LRGLTILSNWKASDWDEKKQSRGKNRKSPNLRELPEEVHLHCHPTANDILTNHDTPSQQICVPESGQPIMCGDVRSILLAMDVYEEVQNNIESLDSG